MPVLSKTQFKDKRNADAVANAHEGLNLKCDECGNVCVDYMDLVEHREKEHNVPRGDADDHTKQ